MTKPDYYELMDGGPDAWDEYPEVFCPTCGGEPPDCYCTESRPVLHIMIDTILRFEDLFRMLPKTELVFADAAVQNRKRFMTALHFAKDKLKSMKEEE